MSNQSSRSPVRKTRVRAIVSVLPAVFLAACVVGPDYERPGLFTPASWANRSDLTVARPAELSQWWTRMNDPLLSSYVAKAVASNLDVEAAKARVREARAYMRQETATLLPTGGGGASVTRTRTPATPGIPADVSTLHRAGLDASWEIDLFGGRRRSIEAARYGLDAAEEDLRNTLLVIVGDVALNYSQARAYQAQATLARRTARSQRESATLTRTMFEAGTAGAVDVSNAEALAASTEADIPSYEIAAAAAIHRLGILLGQPPATLSAEMKRGGAIPRPRFPLPVGIPADVLYARPDVRMAERQLAQATARIGAAEAARYPAVSLTGNIATQALDIADLGKKSTIAWAIGPTATVPIFRQGQLKAAADAARAQRDATFAAYQSSVLTAMEDVENAIVSLSQNRVRSNRLSAAVTAYRTAAEASRTQFEAGATGYLQFLDSQRALYQAESNLIDSQLAIASAYVSLNKALGGGWDGTVDTDTPLVQNERNGPRLASTQ